MPRSLRDAEVQTAFYSLAADAVVVAAYGLILPNAFLAAPRLGCWNLHASLLPRWRGAAPIQRAIMAGDSRTGVDIMRMDSGLDTGQIAMREIVRVHPHETAGDLTSSLAAIGARLLVSALQSMEAGPLELHTQSDVGACYAHKIEKSEAEIDWTQGAETIRNHIHALSPAPGAFSKVLIGNKQESIKIYRAEATTGAGMPGMLLSEDMRIACGAGAIRVLQGQRSGKIAMGGRELMHGASLFPGAIFTQFRAPSFVPQA